MVHAAVEKLYDTKKRPLPAYPAEKDKWPTFSASADGGEGAECLRFDFSRSVNHINNERAIEGVVAWLSLNRDNWPVDMATAFLARDAIPSAFREATRKYFRSLRRHAAKDQKRFRRAARREPQLDRGLQIRRRAPCAVGDRW